MPLQPSQVTANDKMLRIERIIHDRRTPTPERMRQIAEVVAEFRSAVAGSTANPFLNLPPEPVVRGCSCGMADYGAPSRATTALVLELQARGEIQ